MSKKIRLRMLSWLAAVSLLAAMSVGAPVTTAQQSATAVAPANAKSAAIAAATAEVLQETGEIRQLPALRPVKSGAQSRADIERMIIKNLDEDTTPEEMRATQLTLRKLGLVPQDFQYRSFIIGLLTEQVAGYYDPKAQQFYLADWIELEGQKPVISHELTHALQDQHFNLRRFEKWPKGDSDAELAVHALIEGDAMLTMMKYIMRKPERVREFMKSADGLASASEKIESAPRALRESLMFPYDKGMQFVASLNGRGDWKMVSQAYTDLPQSTEQILHADKYFEREAPVKINLPDIGSLLGKGWKRVDYNVNGEWGYYLILDEFLKTPKDSERAAAGWGGDRYAVYEGPKGEVIIMQVTVWDTEQDANEFYASYVERTKRRYPSATPVEIAASIQTPTRQTKVETSEGRVQIEQVGARVLILEGVPSRIDITTLRNAVRQSAK
jgi:hypothetical protein